MCVFNHACMTFSSCDLDFDPMTLTYTFDLDTLKIRLRTKNEVSRSRLAKVEAQTGQTHTKRATECITVPHSGVVNVALTKTELGGLQYV